MLMIAEPIWNVIEELLHQKKSKLVGRPTVDLKLVLSGILYILQTGAQWRHLPEYYGKRSTVHGWFMRWTRNDVFKKVLEVSKMKALERFGSPESFILDTSSIKAPLARFSGKSPVDRAKRGVKKGVIIDINLIVLSTLVDAANRHDSKLLEPQLPNLEPFVEKKPLVLVSDSAWDSQSLRRTLAKKNIALHAATNVRRNSKKEKITPGGRWRVEQFFGITQWFRSLKICWSKTSVSFHALYQFACSLHNFRRAGIFG